MVDYEYFMERMEEWEVYNFYDALQYCNRPEWEQTRLIMYILAQVNSKKHLEMTDILSFPWDDNYEEKNTEMTNEERDRLKEKAKAFEKILKEQNG